MWNVFKRRHKVEIHYPGIECYFDNPDCLEITKPNLRYILNDMERKNHDNILDICTTDSREKMEITFNEENKKFSIYDSENDFFLNEDNSFTAKECLDTLFSITSVWIKK